MILILKLIIKRIFRLFGYSVIKQGNVIQNNIFYSHYYQRNVRRRLEHLSSLNLDIAGSSVLELGAGIGAHTDFFIDRGCRVVASDARKENTDILRSRYPDLKTLRLDLENPPSDFKDKFDIVYCSGLLYHLGNPSEAIRSLSGWCGNMLLLSTAVAYGDESAVYFLTEDPKNRLHSISGRACRPTRKWVYDELKKYFRYVYLSVTQPNHTEFPIDWSCPDGEKLPKTIFVASRKKIDNNLLTEELLTKQMRH